MYDLLFINEKRKTTSVSGWRIGVVFLIKSLNLVKF